MKTLTEKAIELLNKHYANILNGRSITLNELKAEAANVIRKWDDAPFLINMKFACALTKEQWQFLASI